MYSVPNQWTPESAPTGSCLQAGRLLVQAVVEDMHVAAAERHARMMHVVGGVRERVAHAWPKDRIRTALIVGGGLLWLLSCCWACPLFCERCSFEALILISYSIGPRSRLSTVQGTMHTYIRTCAAMAPHPFA